MTNYTPMQALNTKAQQPVVQVAGLAFMMWMSGNYLSIFSLMTVLSGMFQPLSAMIKSGEGARGLGSYVGLRALHEQCYCLKKVVGRA